MESSKSVVVQIVNLETHEVTFVDGLGVIGEDGIPIGISTTYDFTKAQVFNTAYAMLIARSLKNPNVIVNVIKVQ